MKLSGLVVRCCAAVIFFLGFAANVSAQFSTGTPWQVGDIIVCFGTSGGVGGTCNALRMVGNSPMLLDQFSDGLLGHTHGVAMNNTLHAIVADNADGSASDVVVYSIASVDPGTGGAVTHKVVPPSPFAANGGSSGNNAQAVVVDNTGHIFVGNAGSGPTPGVTIVELNPDGSLVPTGTGAMFSNPLPVACADITGSLLSMDLSKDGLSMYLTTSNTTYSTSSSNGGHVQKITLSTGGCAPFASFGPGVALNGIQDVPKGAVSTCNNVGCPNDEMVLVVAEGFFDTDGDPGEVPDQGDDTNICTKSVGSGLSSCALLLATTTGPGLTASPWTGTHVYAVGDMILDANLHVQKAATAGTSGCDVAVSTETCYYTSTPFHPTWKTNGTITNDNAVVWQDQGQELWNGFLNGNLSYSTGVAVVDSAGHVQQVTTAGAPGPGPGGPKFNDGTAGVTTTQDGLVWTLLNCGNSCPAGVGSWSATTDYCSSCGPGGTDNTVIEQFVNPGCGTDCGFAFFQATAPTAGAAPGGISGGSSPVFFDNSNKPIMTPIPDNVVTWTDEGAWTTSTQYQQTAQTTGCGTTSPHRGCVGDTNRHLWLATTNGTSGPGATPPFVANEGGKLTDGVTWTDLGTSLVATYSVAGTSTLTALSLDPLVSDCTGNNCTSSVPSPTVSNFWLGDSAFPNFYEVNFGNAHVTGPLMVNASAISGSCTNCVSANNAEGLRIYGAEGANQPDLTKLFTTPSFLPSPNTQKVQFPLPVNPNDTNSMTVALFPTGISSIPLSIYASQLPLASPYMDSNTHKQGNNSGATDNGFPCQPTTSIKTDCILWKIDAKPASGTNLATKFSTVNSTPPTIDTNTDVFVDEGFDVTTFVGNFDPGGTRLSVHSLNEVAAFTGTQGGSCVYKSPAPKCFQNPGNITFKFSCPTFTGSVGSLRPVLSLVSPPPGTPNSFPGPITLVPTDSNPPNYRFDGTQWVFNWQTQNGTFRATTVDQTHQIQTFFEDFTVAASCTSSVTIASITPNTGSTNGGTQFTIIGTGFATNATVTFVGAGIGNEQATAVKVANNGKSLTGFTPKSANTGLVDVVVSNPGDGSATLFSGFTYTP